MIITIDNKPPINIVDDKDETSILNTIKEFVETNYDNVEKIKILLELLKSDIKNTVKVETGNGTPGTGNGTPGTGTGPPETPGTGTIDPSGNNIDDNCRSKNIKVGIEEYCKKDKDGRYTGTTSNNASLLLHPDKNPGCILEATKKFKDQTNYCEALKPKTGGSTNKLDIVTSAIINSAKKIIIEEIKSVKK